MSNNNLHRIPVIAVRGVCPIPNNDIRLEVGRDASIKALEEAEKNYDNMIVLLAQKDSKSPDLSPANLYEYGTLARIDLSLKLPNNNLKVKFQIKERVKIVNFLQEEPFLFVEYEDVTYPEESQEEASALVRTIMSEIKSGNTLLANPDEIVRKVQSGITTEECANIISFAIKNNAGIDKYRYMSELSVNKRLKYILEDLSREKQIGEIENKINQEVKKSIDESQKEYYLREKMKAIQNELGDKARHDEEIDELREKILNARMPKKIEDKAMHELKRYASTSNQVPEAGVIRSYLDVLINLPWYKESEDINDINKVKETLDKNHYGLDKVKDRILEYLSVKIMTGKNPQTILCLYGPPGVGKTSLAKSIANALGRKFIKQSLGGISDESEIRGHRRTYLGALPGRILKGMKDVGTVNPVFLLDEIDKMSSSYRGDPASAMLEVLDPEQNANFSDNYLEEEYDLSKVLFITTANSLDTIPGPLRDRMEIVELSSYTEHEKLNISNYHLIPKELVRHGLKPEQLTISNEAIYLMIQHYTREAGVRELDRLFQSIIRKSIKEILLEHKDKVEVTALNLEKYLGKQKFFNNENREENQVGIVTGLAYTQFGGDTLDIEVTHYKGKGNIQLTGKLGDVMKESAMAALSYVRSHAKDLGISSDIFENTDIHIHVPEGAVPKDGPSAGVTLTTGIVSALTNKPVDAKLGMTGEITLRGTVLPIGGLKEKSIAALRSGLKTILIPYENQRDIDDIPQEVKDKLEIIPVKHVKDVLKRAIID